MATSPRYSYAARAGAMVIPLAALFVGSAGLFLITVLFYLNHCVVDQPRWAVVGGWAPMLAGLTLLQLQSAFGAWWVSIDINHSGFPLAYCEAVVGSGVVATSWFVAPELFNPRLRRPWVVAIVGVVCVVPIALSGMDGPPTAVAVAVAIIVAALLIAGSRAQWRTFRIPPAQRSSVAAATDLGGSHVSAAAWLAMWDGRYPQVVELRFYSVLA